jgi:hypothetical protein
VSEARSHNLIQSRRQSALVVSPRRSLVRSRLTVDHPAHNRTVAGSNPASATTSDDTVDLASAAQALISDAARRRTLEIVEDAQNQRLSYPAFVKQQIEAIGKVLAIPIREMFRAAVDREMSTMKRERNALRRRVAVAKARR